MSIKRQIISVLGVDLSCACSFSIEDNFVYLVNSDLTQALINQHKTKNKKIINPFTGGLSFGAVPINKHVSAADIFLRLGFIGEGNNRKGAFGARHIWEKHHREFQLAAPSDLPGMVSSILEDGAYVLLTNESIGHVPCRPLVLKASIGLVVLEQKINDFGKKEYSIVTAYGKKNQKGIVIGTLKKPQSMTGA